MPLYSKWATSFNHAEPIQSPSNGNFLISYIYGRPLKWGFLSSGMASTWQKVSRLYRVLTASHITKLVSVCLSRCWHIEAHFTRSRCCEPRLGFVIPVSRQTVWHLCCRRISSRSWGNQRVRSLSSISPFIKPLVSPGRKHVSWWYVYLSHVSFSKLKFDWKGNYVLVSFHSIHFVQQTLKNYISGSYLYQITGDPKFADRVGLKKNIDDNRKSHPTLFRSSQKKGRENHL